MASSFTPPTKARVRVSGAISIRTLPDALLAEMLPRLIFKEFEVEAALAFQSTITVPFALPPTLVPESTNLSALNKLLLVPIISPATGTVEFAPPVLIEIEPR